MPRMAALEKQPDQAAHRARRRQPPGRSCRRRHRPVGPLRARRHSRPRSRCSCSRNMSSRSPRRNLPNEIGRGDPARLLKFPLINDSDASGLARLVRRAGHGLPPAPAGPPLRGLQSGARRRRAWAGHRAGAAAADRASAGVGPHRRRRRAHRAQSGLLLARPAAGRPRAAAAELARRIAVAGRAGAGKDRGVHRGRVQFGSAKHQQHKADDRDGKKPGAKRHQSDTHLLRVSGSRRVARPRRRAALVSLPCRWREHGEAARPLRREAQAKPDLGLRRRHLGLAGAQRQAALCVVVLPAPVSSWRL